MGSNPSGGRSAGPALESSLGPGLGSGADTGAPLEGMLGEQPAPLETQDVEQLRQRKRFSDFWSQLGLGEGGNFNGFGGIGESMGERGGGFGGGGGSRGK
jgi:hypothetical protein